MIYIWNYRFVSDDSCHRSKIFILRVGAGGAGAPASHQITKSYVVLFDITIYYCDICDKRDKVYISIDISKT
jgi:hypothetical protein